MTQALPAGMLALLLLLSSLAGAELPEGYWGLERSQPILDTTLRITLNPDLSHLSAAEFAALEELLAAGRIVHTLYEEQLHAAAASSLASLIELHAQSGASRETQNLLDLYYLSNGPVATTLDNVRQPFLPVAAETAGKNVYPADLSRAEIDAFLARNPRKQAEIKAERSVVRRATAENLAADIARLDRHAAIDALHDGLRVRLLSEAADARRFYVVPYALAYADALGTVRRHLNAAARLLHDESPDFAAYLENRARDLLSGNYESGDASWVSGDFGNLNIQIGSYETYDDSLLGIKSFFGASVLARDPARSDALAAAMSDLQAIEESLPYQQHRSVRSRIPVGVYKVIADFGQARGTNTATILPNDADYARKYGRTILIRYNILAHPLLNAEAKKKFDAVVDARFQQHLTANGQFNRTLWHEVGHYLGVARTADGVTLGAALADKADLLEELKSDLVSLFAAPALRASGYHNDEELRAHYADGIRRTLQVNQPRPDQPYQTMQLMQFNYYLELGLLELDGDTEQLLINYDRYHEVVREMLRDVLRIQYEGDITLAGQFIERWGYWDDTLHGVLARQIQASGGYRRTMVRYYALGD